MLEWSEDEEGKDSAYPRLGTIEASETSDIKKSLESVGAALMRQHSAERDTQNRFLRERWLAGDDCWLLLTYLSRSHPIAIFEATTSREDNANGRSPK
jgi:hypothetical protein